MKFLITGILIIILIFACRPEKEVIPDVAEFKLDLPAGFPQPHIPDNNKLTAARVKLGKSLFFDLSLSRDSSLSCASCHKPGQAFADNLPVSPGVKKRLGIRNSPSLLNVAYQKDLLADGGVPTLELQAFTPITDHAEMDYKLDSISLRLKNTVYYKEWSQKAYHRELDSYAITHALASYQRTLYSGNSLYDEFVLSRDSSLFSKEALAGMNLFFSDKTNCSTCHSGFLFSDMKFHNIGLPELVEDPGRARITLKNSDRNKFKTPSLRNIMVTAPYMHNGSLQNLEDVINFFNEGGAHDPNKSELIKPLNLSDNEKQALIAFLETLTDKKYTNLAAN